MLRPSVLELTLNRHESFAQLSRFLQILITIGGYAKKLDRQNTLLNAGKDTTMNTTLVLLISPLIALQIALQLYALYDVVKRSSTRETTTTLLWVLVILAFNLLGPILYFVLGQREQEVTA
jgi:hypothetical protein